MPKNSKILLITVVGFAGIVLFLYIMGEQAHEPASSLIVKERDKLARSLQDDPSPRNASAAAESAEKLADLDHRLAMAYIAENRPDTAVAVLERLIRDEEGRGAGEGMRSPRSYRKLSRYYEALSDAYELMRNDSEAMSAKNKRIEMLSKAEDAKRREVLKEGKTVGRSRE